MEGHKFLHRSCIATIFDLIESLIRGHSAPKRLTVVSNDHRIQHAARRRECVVLGCEAYLEWLDRHRRRSNISDKKSDAKPHNLSIEEAQHWLREFADLQDNPAMKELSDPPEWQEADRRQEE